MKKKNHYVLIDISDGMAFGEMNLSLTKSLEVCASLRFTPTRLPSGRPTHVVVEEQSGILLGFTHLRYLRDKEFVLPVRVTPKGRS